jgi:hypothetical protein
VKNNATTPQHHLSNRIALHTRAPPQCITGVHKRQYNDMARSSGKRRAAAAQRQKGAHQRRIDEAVCNNLSSLLVPCNNTAFLQKTTIVLLPRARNKKATLTLSYYNQQPTIEGPDLHEHHTANSRSTNQQTNMSDSTRRQSIQQPTSTSPYRYH